MPALCPAAWRAGHGPASRTRRPVTAAMAAAGPDALGVDGALAASLLSEGALPWSPGCSGPWSSAAGLVLPASRLADPQERGPVLLAVLDAIRPRLPRLQKVLQGPLREASSAALAAPDRRPAAPSGAEVAQRPGRGRALIALSRLERGRLALREQPLAWVRLGGQAGAGAPRLGPGGLAPETALALRLWQAVLKGHGPACAAAKTLESRGGADPLFCCRCAVVAASFALVARASDAAAPDEVSMTGALFDWLRRVRVNAVAVTSVTERKGEMEISKGALALFPALAASVNHDCRPNALLRFGGKEGLDLELVVSDPQGVAAGAEVAISYGPTAASHPRAERSVALLDQYGFRCTCAACSDSRPEDFSWRERAAALDKRAQREASGQKWDAAVAACSASLTLLRQGYAAGDVELAREECKLAGLLLQANDVDRARERWASAADVLSALVALADPDREEAEEMLKRLPAPRHAKAAAGAAKPQASLVAAAHFGSSGNKQQAAAAAAVACDDRWPVGSPAWLTRTGSRHVISADRSAAAAAETATARPSHKPVGLRQSRPGPLRGLGRLARLLGAAALASAPRPATPRPCLGPSISEPGRADGGGG